MKTLADLKRNIRPGMRLRVADHWLERYRGTTRVVTRVQTNGYWFRQGGEDHFSAYGYAHCYTFPTETSYRYKNGSQFWEVAIVPAEGRREPNPQPMALSLF